MQRWREEFVAYTQRKCVHIHINGDFEHGKVLYLEPDWSYLDFLNAASHRLGTGPTAMRCFNSDGVEINDCMMIEDDDMLFLSSGEEFIPPFDQSVEVDDGDSQKIEGEKIPHSIGGYKTGDLLGRGGFGEVRVGEHHITNEKVALKFLRKSEIHSLNAAERTNLEIQCLMALKHNNIIRLQQHLESQQHVILVFELMEGGDLLKYLIQRQAAMRTPKANLTEDEARHVFYQVVSAVSYAHNQHICHRDLKLENILLKDTTLNVVKIADFGLSDFYRPGAVMKSSCGTLSFLAPEVFKGTANAGPPLDVWAMGVILFALLCGRLPFEGPDLIGTKRPRDAVIKSRIMKCQYKLDDNLGMEAKDLLRRLLQADPAERITVSEIFNHSWVRTASSNHFIDLFHQFQQHQQQQQQQQQTATTSGLSPMVSGVTTPAAGFDSVASSLSPSLKVRKGGPTAALLETIPPTDQLSVLMPTEDPIHYDALRSHLATPPSTSPTSTSSKHHHPTGGIFSSPTPTTMANGGAHTGSLPFSTSNGSLASLSPVPLYPSRRRSRTKDVLGNGINALTSSSGNDLASLDLSPRPNLSPQTSGDRSSLGSTDGSHSSGGTNGSGNGNGNGNGHNKSTIKLIPLRRNNSNVASHQNSNSDLLGSGGGSGSGGHGTNSHSHGNGGHGSSAAVAQLLHHDHTELPSLTQRLSNGASHAMGIAQLLGASASTGGSNNNHYNNNVGDDSSVVSTASAPTSQPPRGINRPSTVNASNRGRNIINSIVKEEDHTIVSPVAAPPSTSSTLESPYGSRKHPSGARKATSSASNSNATTSGNSGAGNAAGASMPTLSNGAANKGDAVGGPKRAASAVPSHATTSSTTSGAKDTPYRSATVPPMLGAVGAQRSQTSMSSSNLTASTSPRPPVGSSGMGHTHHHHVDDTVIPGLAMNTDSHLHHQPYQPSTAMSATARTAVTKPFNTVGTVTSTGKTRFL